MNQTLPTTQNLNGSTGNKFYCSWIKNSFMKQLPAVFPDAKVHFFAHCMFFPILIERLQILLKLLASTFFYGTKSPHQY